MGLLGALFPALLIRRWRDLQPMLSFNFLLIVVEEIDRVLFEVSALVIILDNHSDVFVSGHALHLAVGEAQA